jgi:hypothetical protein
LIESDQTAHITINEEIQHKAEAQKVLELAQSTSEWKLALSEKKKGINVYRRKLNVCDSSLYPSSSILTYLFRIKRCSCSNRLERCDAQSTPFIISWPMIPRITVGWRNVPPVLRLWNSILTTQCFTFIQTCFSPLHQGSSYVRTMWKEVATWYTLACSVSLESQDQCRRDLSERPCLVC